MLFLGVLFLMLKEINIRKKIYASRWKSLNVNGQLNLMNFNVKIKFLKKGENEMNIR